jgi:PTS system mannose-specific IIA component
MRAFVLISHGTMAQAMKESIQMIAGIHGNLFAASLEVDDSPESFGEKLAEIDSQLGFYSEIVVYCDMFGGSPANAALQRYLFDPRVTLLSGMNFPMVLAGLLEADVDIPYLIESGKGGIVDIKAAMRDISNSDE